MDAAALLGVCAVLASGRTAPPLSPVVVCPPAQRGAAPRPVAAMGVLAGLVKAPSARAGIARVAFAEAGDQGDSGLAAVVYAILNRLADGRWGFSVDQVLNARGQFEPVTRVGGDWRSLPPVPPAGQARIDTILNLALDGRLPDLTHGARFFQNPAIVAQRARDGTVSARQVNFGGATPSAVIGAHSFFIDPASGSGIRAHPARSASLRPDVVVVPAARADAAETAGPSPSAPSDATPASALGDPSQALFIGRDGTVRGAAP